MKLKICGMKFTDNIKAVATLQPDYLGFIFYHKSKRYFEGMMPKLPESIKKVGVFVNETVNEVVGKIVRYQLEVVQLHGDESVDFVKQLRQALQDLDLKNIAIIKVFSVDANFDFSVILPFETVVDYYLFDTKGKESGGNGVTFDWTLLDNYPSTKPYFLSGGIGLESVDNLKQFIKSEASKYCYALDVNSRFETAPGLKNIKNLKAFKNQIL